MITANAELLDKDIQILLNESVSEKAQAKELVTFVKAEVQRAANDNRKALRQNVRFKVYVDNAEDQALRTVKADSTIRIEFELIDEVLKWIADQLEKHSPVGKTRLYQRSHMMFADGVEVPEGRPIPGARQYVFINTVPYARKIERGMSSQAPDGVYQVVAVLARRRFGNMAKINYTFRTAVGGRLIGGRIGNRAAERNPAITVELR